MMNKSFDDRREKAKGRKSNSRKNVTETTVCQEIHNPKQLEPNNHIKTYKNSVKNDRGILKQVLFER